VNALLIRGTHGRWITPILRSWRADEMPGGYVANGQALAYLYSRENEAEARQAKVLTNDEAHRALPELLGKAERA
jgi:hypothetical protein